MIGWEQVIAWRAARHGLSGDRAPRDAAFTIVDRLCGLHGQVQSSAELMLAAHVDGVTRDDFTTWLYDERRLIKTWAMRGTLHVLTKGDYRVWQAGTAVFDHFRKHAWHRAFGVTDADIDAIISGVGDVLSTGEALTREQLADAVAATAGEHLGEKLRDNRGALLKPAAFAGQLCFAEPDGQKVRFTHPDLIVGPAPDQPDEPMHEIVRRCLAVHGPMTREDFGRWWGERSAAKAGRHIKALGDEVRTVTLPDDGHAWILARDHDDLLNAEPPQAVRLLPAFDQWVIAATRHAAHLMAADRTADVYRPQGWLTAVVLVDGRIEGTWAWERKGGRVVIEVNLWVDGATTTRKAIEEEAARVAAYLGAELELLVHSPGA
jgi:winged helix DNA-binding protein